MDIFEKWGKEFNEEELAKDAAEVSQNNSGSYKQVPHGDYEVEVHQMELKESSKGNPMVSIWFKIVSDGEFKGSMIFMNQVVTQNFQIHIVNDILRTMVSEMPDAPVVEFKTYKQYANIIMDVFEAVNGNYEFALSYKKGKNDFSTYEITEVFTLE